MDDISYRRNHIQGFTIIEIIAVLLLLAITGVVAVARLTSTSSYKVVSETEILKTHLRYAQIRALSEGDLTFGINNATWGILISANSFTLQTNRTISIHNLPNESSPTHTVPTGISITSSYSPVTYDIWGKPVDATGNAVAGNIVITLTDGNSPQSFTVSPMTGFIQ